MSKANPFTPQRGKLWKPKVLEYIALGLGVRKACELAGVHNNAVYRELRANPEFLKEWQEALDRSVVILEAEAVRRASVCSDFLLWKLLSSRLKSRFGETGSNIGGVGVTPNIELNISVREKKTNEPDAQ